MSGDAPREPLTATGEASVALHEMFLSLLAAGFTQWQALRVLGVMLAEQGRQE